MFGDREETGRWYVEDVDKGVRDVLPQIEFYRGD